MCVCVCACVRVWSAERKHGRTRGSSSDSGRLTVPRTPKLETRHRLRPNTTISQSQRDEMEFQEARKYVTVSLHRVCVCVCVWGLFLVQSVICCRLLKRNVFKYNLN